MGYVYLMRPCATYSYGSTTVLRYDLDERDFNFNREEPTLRSYGRGRHFGRARGGDYPGLKERCVLTRGSSK